MTSRLQYDFDGLSGDQRALLTLGGWEWTREMQSEPPRATVDPLLVRGLLVLHHMRERPLTEGIERRGMVRRSYEVPSDVTRAWQAYLASDA